MTLHIPFDNSYARLPDRFYTRLAPVPVKAPGLVRINGDLARELGLDPDALARPEGLAVLAGNAVPKGADPLAQAYAGHQFGGWVPQLGDGRAILLGEVIDRDGRRRDIQLKGSGPTPYSRMGDGRAWLGPVLREYVVSEAMHALGIPTTRSLAAVTTGETILREGAMPGAVLTRVAASHIRVGTFQFFAARGDTAALQTLLEHALSRHEPGGTGARDLLRGVIARQARLVAQWMGVGFVHGVMNTDNSTISGETIDYGPCAFMDAYHPETVFSSIDQFGRYAFNRQPDVMVWNLAQLASALLPVWGADEATAIAEATEDVHGFPDLFRTEWAQVFRAKLGLGGAEDDDGELIHRLLDLMAKGGSDFTNTFRALGSDAARDQIADRDGFDAWQADWLARRSRDPLSDEDGKALMARSNPAVIPRNHRIEAAIQAAVAGDLGPFETLVRILKAPFALAAEDAAYATPPTEDERVIRTFCGT